MARGPYKKGTTVYASSCRVYKISVKFNMYTSRCVFIYNNTHQRPARLKTRSGCPMIFPGSTLRGVNRCGWPKQETCCCADRSDIGSWRSRTCCVIFYRATVMGRGRDSLSEHGWLSVERSWMCRLYYAELVKLQRSAFNMF